MRGPRRTAGDRAGRVLAIFGPLRRQCLALAEETAALSPARVAVATTWPQLNIAAAVGAEVVFAVLGPGWGLPGVGGVLAGVQQLYDESYLLPGDGALVEVRDNQCVPGYWMQGEAVRERARLLGLSVFQVRVDAPEPVRTRELLVRAEVLPWSP